MIEEQKDDSGSVPLPFGKQTVVGSTVILGDCVELMKGYADGHFDLAVVDPPYFKGAGSDGFYGKKFTKEGRKKGHYKGIDNWDMNIPDENYFEELKRISKHQIIWGINYYEFSGCTGRLIWDKQNDDSTFSNCEIASCTLISHVKIFRYLWNGMLQKDMKNKEVRIHPTQKPVALYDWVFSNYAKEGMKILDTHLGSGSSRIAAHKAGLDFTGMELDEHYYDAQEKRFNNYKSQLRIEGW